MSLSTKYWTYLHENGSRFESLRNPRSTKFLTVTFFTSVIVALIAEILALVWIHTIWVFFAAMLIAMVAWTILRSTIDAKDAAPPEMLDDYELEVLSLWRRRSLGALNVALFVGGFVFMFGSFLLDPGISPGLVGFVAGMYMIYVYFLVSTLPAVGYAVTFNQFTEDEA